MNVEVPSALGGGVLNGSVFGVVPISTIEGVVDNPEVLFFLKKCTIPELPAWAALKNLLDDAGGCLAAAKESLSGDSVVLVEEISESL